MKRVLSMVAVVACVTMVLSTQVWAQPVGGGARGGGARGGMGMGRGIYGDWKVSQEFNGMQMDSILSFSRGQEGGMTGQWISTWGLNELTNVQFEDGQLTFTRTMQGFGGGEPMSSTFKGTISDEGVLTGTISGGRQPGDSAIKGQRMPRMPRSAGVWDLTMAINDRQVPVTLTISANAEGEPAAKWTSQRGEATVSNIESSRRDMSFTVKSENADMQWEATFEGTIEGDTLTGTLSSEMGEMTVQGQRKGADVIGTWNLELASERGARQQRLVINPDLTALYGATEVKNVTLQDGQVSFSIEQSFGGQSMEQNFTGKIQDSKLEGELETQMGSQKVTGTRAATRGMRRGQM